MTLGNDKISPLRSGATDADKEPRTFEQIGECIDAAYEDATFPKTTFVDAMLDVQAKDQWKEMILMLCLKAAVDPNLTFPTGNQTAVDCVFNGVPSQCKTHDVIKGHASCKHKVKGVVGQSTSTPRTPKFPCHTIIRGP